MDDEDVGISKFQIRNLFSQQGTYLVLYLLSKWCPYLLHVGDALQMLLHCQIFQRSKV